MSTGVAIVAVDVTYQQVQLPPGAWVDNRRCVYVPICCPGDGTGTAVSSPGDYDMTPGTFDPVTRTWSKGVVGFMVELADVHISSSDLQSVSAAACMESCNRPSYCSDISYVGPCVDEYGNVTENCRLYPRHDRLCVDFAAAGVGISTTRTEVYFNPTAFEVVPNGSVAWSRGGSYVDPFGTTRPIFEASSGVDIVISFKCQWLIPPGEDPTNPHLRLGGVVGAFGWLRDAGGTEYVFDLPSNVACRDSGGFPIADCGWSGAGTGNVSVFTGGPPPLPPAGTIVVTGPFVCDPPSSGDNLLGLTKQAVNANIRGVTTAPLGTVRNPSDCCSGTGGGGGGGGGSGCLCEPTNGVAGAIEFYVTGTGLTQGFGSTWSVSGTTGSISFAVTGAGISDCTITVAWTCGSAECGASPRSRYHWTIAVSGGATYEYDDCFPGCPPGGTSVTHMYDSAILTALGIAYLNLTF